MVDNSVSLDFIQYYQTAGFEKKSFYYDKMFCFLKNSAAKVGRVSLYFMYFSMFFLGNILC